MPLVLTFLFWITHHLNKTNSRTDLQKKLITFKGRGERRVLVCKIFQGVAIFYSRALSQHPSVEKTHAWCEEVGGKVRVAGEEKGDVSLLVLTLVTGVCDGLTLSSRILRGLWMSASLAGWPGSTSSLSLNFLSQFLS